MQHCVQPVYAGIVDCPKISEIRPILDELSKIWASVRLSPKLR